MALGLRLVLIQQTAATSRGTVRRRTSGDPSQQAGRLAAPQPGDRCPALGPGPQRLVEEGSFQGAEGPAGQLPLGVGITGNTN